MLNSFENSQPIEMTNEEKLSYLEKTKKEKDDLGQQVKEVEELQKKKEKEILDFLRNNVDISKIPKVGEDFIFSDDSDDNIIKNIESIDDIRTKEGNSFTYFTEIKMKDGSKMEFPSNWHRITDERQNEAGSNYTDYKIYSYLSEHTKLVKNFLK